MWVFRLVSIPDSKQSSIDSRKNQGDLIELLGLFWVVNKNKHHSTYGKESDDKKIIESYTDAML